LQGKTILISFNQSFFNSLTKDRRGRIICKLSDSADYEKSGIVLNAEFCCCPDDPDFQTPELDELCRRSLYSWDERKVKKFVRREKKWKKSQSTLIGGKMGI
jgi:hypothetical protein